MRKTELKNCPQWLMEADTENEDVLFEEKVLVWRSGNFLGGNFLGGDFRGGNFLGGNFLGGDFRGGNFWGGNFRGGDFWGGDFRGGDFLGGNFLGEAMHHTPLVLVGLEWKVTITPTRLIIGCQSHTYDAWSAFNDDEIARMATGAPAFWKNHKEVLLSLCEHYRSTL